MQESPSPTPPTGRFYSDGRPRPLHDGDNESKDSFEDGYTTAAVIPRHQFVDPDQPKLLPAEEDDSIQPHLEKRPLHDEYSKWCEQDRDSTGVKLVWLSVL